MKPVSIIIVNWNGRHHLEHSLPALAQQTCRAKELIVVDNGSTDGSIEFIARFPAVTLIEAEENLGFTGGNKLGLQASSGEYVVLLNNDTRVEPDWLERLVAYADSHPGHGIVASLMLSWDGAFIDTAGDGYTVTGRGIKLGQSLPSEDRPKSGEVFGACAGAVLYRRSMIDDVGFFDDRYFMNAEDTDLGVRARLKGWTAGYCAEAVVYHRIGGSQSEMQGRGIYYAARNHLWTLIKCMPTELLVKYSGSHVIHGLAELAIHTRHGNAGAFIAGHIDALRRLPEFLRDRRAIQEDARISHREFEKHLMSFTALLERRRNRKKRLSRYSSDRVPVRQ